MEHWKPISAFVRVIPDENLDALLDWGLGTEAAIEYEEAALGIVLGEAATQLATVDGVSRRRTGTRLSLISCLATCSFVLGRANALGWQFPERTAEKWFLARSVLGKPASTVRPETILAPWSILSRLGGSKTLEQDASTAGISDICKGLHETGEVIESALASLTKGWPDLREAFNHMDGPLEDRTRWFDKAIGATMRKRREIPRSVVFAFALLASRISPGSFSHVGLLIPYLPKLNEIVLWYGFCAGVTRGSALSAYSGNLGRRVLRDLMTKDDVFSRPRCDLSVEELQVISASSAFVQTIPNAVPGRLLVEIGPGVNTIVSLHHGAPVGPRQYSMFAELNPTLEAAFRDLDRALAKTRRVLGRARNSSQRK